MPVSVPSGSSPFEAYRERLPEMTELSKAMAIAERVLSHSDLNRRTRTSCPLVPEAHDLLG
jgi:hypothetical protein